MNTVFGFIGTGNMGGALARAVSKSPEAVPSPGSTHWKAVPSGLLP